jgi:hypothetical protein
MTSRLLFGYRARLNRKNRLVSLDFSISRFYPFSLFVFLFVCYLLALYPVLYLFTLTNPVRVSDL